MHQITLYGVNFNQQEYLRLQNQKPIGRQNYDDRNMVRLGQLELIRDACSTSHATLASLLTEALKGLPGLNCIRFQDKFWDPTHDYENSFRPCDSGVPIPGWTFKLLTNALAKSKHTAERLVLNTELHPDSS